MSLKVWIPGTDGTLKNQGLSNITPSCSSLSANNSGKLGNCVKVSASVDTGLTYDQWNFRTTNIAFGGWVKFVSSEINSVISGFEYTSTYKTAGGSLFGYDYYGGASIFWETNNIYSSGSLSSISLRGTLRNKSGGAYATSSYAITFGEWIHVMYIIDRTNNKLLLYINGNLVGSGTTFDSSIVTEAKTSNFKLNTATWPSGNGQGASVPVYYNDVRLYVGNIPNASEVKEISKGLVAHYTLGSASVYEATTNKFTYPTPGSAVGAVGWDQSLHPNAIHVSGWAYGYNSGVTDPGTVYHAMWNMIDGIPTMVFLDLNSTKGHRHSWEGISGGGLVTSDFTSGKKYTVSFTAKSSVDGGAISCGLYYKRTSSEGYSFYDDCPQTTLTTTWKRYSVTYTSQGANSISAFYFYGHNGNEGIKYVRDILLEFLDHATPYTPSSRSTGIVYDSSGYCRNGIISGIISPANSVRYDKSIYMDGTSAINIGNVATYVPDGNLTVNLWFYKDSYSSKSYDTVFGGPSGFEIETKPHVSNEPGYHICPHNWGTDHTANTEIPYEFNKWNMLTMVRTSSNSKWYLNGELKRTLNPATIPSGDYFIGAWRSATEQNFKGRVSDCRIFATALSADDVKDLYNLGALIS